MLQTSERIKQILLIIATVGVIGVNYLAGTGRIGGVTPEAISDKYPTFVTPAGYAFSIWGLLYLGLILFSVYQILPANTARFAKIRTLYILSCAANCAWIYLWHHEQIVLSLIVILVLLGTLILINIRLLKSESAAEFLLARLPFNIYFGWITVAAVLNFTIALVFIGVKASDSVAVFLACALIVAVTVLGIFIRQKLSNAAFAVTIAWALTAIAVKQNHQTTLIIFAAFCVIALLISALTYFLQTPKTIEMNNGKICVSVCAETADIFSQDIKRARALGDFIELRFDCLEKGEIEKVEFEYDENYIRTFRPREQGGKRELSLEEREDFWDSGEDYCGGDFEEDVVKKSFGWLYQPVICSHHNFSKVPNNLFEIYERLKAIDADVLKIAVQADSVTDSIAVWKLLERAKSENKQIIPIAMGEAGKWTRILGLAHGAFMTYAALESGKETASGQITAEDLIETYRVKELDRQTEIYGIVGNPVSHSVSPFMHNAAFKFHRLNAVYIPFEVKNLDEFIEKFIRRETREVELNFKGFSVTIPHKTEIIKHLDSIDETAEAIGAVNTVKIVGGKLHGCNTDAHGFVEPLKTAYGDLNAVKIAILGSGGAARACAYALKKEKADVTIYARNLDKAKNLAKEFDVSCYELNFQKSNLASSDIIVNATPLGMKGNLETDAPISAEQIKNARLVYDLVYNPFETRLIKEARKANVPTLGGLAMLVAQGAKQFEIWTGKDAPSKLMSAAALRKLK